MTENEIIKNEVIFDNIEVQDKEYLEKCLFILLWIDKNIETKTFKQIKEFIQSQNLTESIENKLLEIIQLQNKKVLQKEI